MCDRFFFVPVGEWVSGCFWAQVCVFWAEVSDPLAAPLTPLPPNPAAKPTRWRTKKIGSGPNLGKCGEIGGEREEGGSVRGAIREVGRTMGEFGGHIYSLTHTTSPVSLRHSLCTFQ